MTELTLNLAAFLPGSRANGPGLRAVVWVQGCPLRCRGCWNPETLPFVERERVPVTELAHRILGLPGVEGVTFSGGEPFAQAEGLAQLGALLKRAGLNIITFSGYRYERLASAGRRDWDGLLAVTDLLADGPYVEGFRAQQPMRGSSNKRLIFLTDALRGHPYFQDEAGQSFEIHLGADGQVATTGFPPFDPAELRAYLADLGVEDSR